MLDIIVTLSGLIAGVLGIVFGLYQLRRADRARKDEQEARRELAGLQAIQAERAASRERMFEVYRASLSLIERLKPPRFLRPDAISSPFQSVGGIGETVAAMTYIHDMAEILEGELNEDWNAYDAYVVEARELMMVASPETYDAVQSLLYEGEGYREFVLEAVNDLKDLGNRGGDPMLPWQTQIAKATMNLHKHLSTYSAAHRRVEEQMRADLAPDS